MHDYMRSHDASCMCDATCPLIPWRNQWMTDWTMIQAYHIDECCTLTTYVQAYVIRMGIPNVTVIRGVQIRVGYFRNLPLFAPWPSTPCHMESSILQWGTCKPHISVTAIGSLPGRHLSCYGG